MLNGAVRRGLAADRPASCAAARGCTTRQHKTHITDARELRYPWHPWAGREVFIHGAVGKSDSPALHCSLDPSTTPRLIQIPQWMFDPAVSYEAQLRDSPSVDAAALLQLKLLLSSLIGPRVARVLQAQHPSQDDAGESDVPFIEATAPSATAAVSSHPEAPALVGTTGGGSATDTRTARATAARRRARTSGRCSVRGAVR